MCQCEQHEHELPRSLHLKRAEPRGARARVQVVAVAVAVSFAEYVCNAGTCTDEANDLQLLQQQERLAHRQALKDRAQAKRARKAARTAARAAGELYIEESAGDLEDSDADLDARQHADAKADPGLLAAPSAAGIEKMFIDAHIGQPATTHGKLARALQHAALQDDVPGAQQHWQLRQVCAENVLCHMLAHAQLPSYARCTCRLVHVDLLPWVRRCCMMRTSTSGCKHLTRCMLVQNDLEQALIDTADELGAETIRREDLRQVERQNKALASAQQELAQAQDSLRRVQQQQAALEAQLCKAQQLDVPDKRINVKAEARQHAGCAVVDSDGTDAAIVIDDSDSDVGVCLSFCADPRHFLVDVCTMVLNKRACASCGTTAIEPAFHTDARSQ